LRALERKVVGAVGRLQQRWRIRTIIKEGVRVR
jgi:hypothetical protein